MIYSYSRISCFNECPRRFSFKYVDRVAPEGESVERLLGSIVHESLEGVYARRLDLDGALDYYRRLWDGASTDKVIINSGRGLGEYMSLGEEHIGGFFRMNAPLDFESVYATELGVNVDLLGDGNYRLRGFIDRVDCLGDGMYEIHDYKTGQRVPSQRSLDSDLQLALYEMGLRQRIEGVESVEYVWHFTSHARKQRSKRSGDQLLKAKTDVVGMIHRIEESIVDGWYPMVKTPKCMWCEYRQHCRDTECLLTDRQTRITCY
jgi:putative RecB family exonuclease